MYELNAQNIKIEKDKKKLKNYEKIIQTEKNKNKKAENIIFELRQEIEFLKKSCNKNISYYTLRKANKNNYNDNKLRANSCREFNGLNPNFNFSNNLEKNDCLINSNDIPFRINDEIGKNNLSMKQNRFFTLSEEFSSPGNRSNNLDNNYMDNDIIHNQDVFCKIKGNDIDANNNNKLYSFLNENEEMNNNLFF